MTPRERPTMGGSPRTVTDLMTAVAASQLHLCRLCDNCRSRNWRAIAPIRPSRHASGPAKRWLFFKWDRWDRLPSLAL